MPKNVVAAVALETLAVVIASIAQGGDETMSVERIAEQLQPVWTRTASAVTVRLQPALVRTAAASRNAAGALSFLLRNAALTALVLGAWRLGNDLGWTQRFFIAAGIWSHWQVWLALAIGLNAAAGQIVRPRRRRAGNTTR